ncbi:unnamed protein product, partial [Sphagnum balticum]
MLRRGKDEKKIRDVMSCLIRQEPLEPKHHDHKLIGNWKGRRDCHVEPDWVLIYQIDESAALIISSAPARILISSADNAARPSRPYMR